MFLAPNVLVGEPKKIEELGLLRLRVDWLSLLQKIPVGFGQEVNISRSIANFNIKKLVNEGKIQNGEFVVRSRKGKIFVLHLRV